MNSLTLQGKFTTKDMDVYSGVRTLINTGLNTVDDSGNNHVYQMASVIFDYLHNIVGIRFVDI